MPAPAKFRKTCAVSLEATYGTEVFPASADFYQQMDGFSLDFSRENIEEPDYSGVADRIGSIAGNRVCTFTLPLTVRPSGTGGTAPDADEVIKSMLPTRVDNTADAVQAGSPTTTTYDIATGSNVTDNTFVLTSGTGYAKPELRFCTDETGNTLTVTPPHSAAPTAGDAVGATNTYTAGDRASTAMLTLGAFTADGANAIVKSLLAVSCVPNVIEWEWSKDGQFLKRTISGEGNGDVRDTGVGTLDGALDNSQTDVTVDELAVFDVGSKIYIDTEAMDVTAKASDTGGGDLTVTRAYDGTSAAAHSDNAVIRPYRPTVSLPSVVPVPVIYADAFIGTSGTQATITRLSVRFEREVSYVRDATTDELVSRYVDGRYMVTVDMDLVLLDTEEQHTNLAAGRWNASKALLIQMGNAAGKVVGFYFPTWYPQMQPLDMDGEGHYSVTLSGEARGTITGNDTFYLGYG